MYVCIYIYIDHLGEQLPKVVELLLQRRLLLLRRGLQSKLNKKDITEMKHE